MRTLAIDGDRQSGRTTKALQALRDEIAFSPNARALYMGPMETMVDNVRHILKGDKRIMVLSPHSFNSFMYRGYGFHAIAFDNVMHWDMWTYCDTRRALYPCLAADGLLVEVYGA